MNMVSNHYLNVHDKHGARLPTGGTCPGAAPTADNVKAFCAAQTFPAPTAATAAAFCRGEIDIIGAGKYAGHTLM